MYSESLFPHCNTNLSVDWAEEVQLMEEECAIYKKLLEDEPVKNYLESLTLLEKELKELQMEEVLLTSDITHFLQEEQAIDRELHQMKQQEEMLRSEEQRYWKKYTRAKHEFILLEEEMIVVYSQIAYTERQLHLLEHTNVFTATFNISYCSQIGSINGFKLGYLPAAPVEWQEVNSALGQAILLLHSLAKKAGIRFNNYRLIPYGSHSSIEVLSEQKILPIYASGLFRFYMNKKFDYGLAAFLDCMQQFEKAVEKEFPGFNVPYQMVNGKIKDPLTASYVSVKMQHSSPENWTKALKFLLTNLKWFLAWVSYQMLEDKKDLVSI